MTPRCLFCDGTAKLTIAESPTKDIVYVWCDDCRKPSFFQPASQPTSTGTEAVSA